MGLVGASCVLDVGAWTRGIALLYVLLSILL